MKKKSVVLIASVLLVSVLAMGVSYADNSKQPGFDPLSNVQKIKQKI